VPSDRELIGDSRRRNVQRIIWTLVLGLFLGGLLTKLSELFLPESTAREFLTTSVHASIGPFSIDLVAVALTVGPLVMTLNVLTLVGVGIVAFIARSWI
jgi:hypothetical protein